MSTQKKWSLKKKIIIMSCIVLFLILNVVWYIGVFHQYLMCRITMREQSGYNSDGCVVDEDEYCFDVHYPTYLYWPERGNLSISQPLDYMGESPDDDGKSLFVSSSGMIIWMKYFSKGVDEVGVILVQDGVSRQIYLEDNETARYPDDQPYVDAGQEEVDKLFRKAEEVWGIEMPWKNS